MTWNRYKTASKMAHRDANQKAITDGLDQLGISWVDTSAMGDDFPDLVVGFRGYNHLAEIKRDTGPPSKRKLSEGQERWHKDWQGADVIVVQTLEELLQRIGCFDRRDAQGSETP